MAAGGTGPGPAKCHSFALTSLTVWCILWPVQP